LLGAERGADDDGAEGAGEAYRGDAVFGEVDAEGPGGIDPGMVDVLQRFYMWES
jgi:hypothetical protein